LDHREADGDDRQLVAEPCLPQTAGNGILKIDGGFAASELSW